MRCYLQFTLWLCWHCLRLTQWWFQRTRQALDSGLYLQVLCQYISFGVLVKHEVRSYWTIHELNNHWSYIFVLSDTKREAIDLLLKASGYLEFCLRDILPRIPPEIRYILNRFKFVKLVLDQHWTPFSKVHSHNIQEHFSPRLTGGCVGGYCYSNTRPGTRWSLSLELHVQAFNSYRIQFYDWWK